MKIGEPPSYTNKLAQPGVLEIINENKTCIEPFAFIIDDALIRYNVQNLNNLDHFAQAENDETFSLLTQPESSGRDENNVSDFSSPVPVDTIYLHDNEISELIRSLNRMQRQVFSYIYHCARNVVKHSIVLNAVQSFHVVVVNPI